MKKLLVCLLSLLIFVGCGASNGGSSTTDPEKETFTVGMECNYAPFNWTQLEANETGYKMPDGSYCDGYDVVMAQAIADGLGKELVIKAINWDGLEPALNNGEIDAIIAGMTETPARAENASFTTPYYESEMVMIVKADGAYANATSIQDFNGATVRGQLNTTYDEIIDQIEGVTHAEPLANYPIMIVTLKSNEVDALTAELPVALGTVSANPDLTIIRFEDGLGFEADTTVSVAVRLADTELRDQINEILNSISIDTRNQWMLDATSRQPAGE